MVCELKEFLLGVKVTQSSPTLCNLMDYTVHRILQARILKWVAFPFSRGSSQPRGRTQVSRGQILYQLSHKRSPRILEWVAYPFSSRSSQPRNQTGVSCIAGRFFTNWAIREAPPVIYVSANLFSPFLSLSSVLQKNLFNLIFLKFFKNYLQVIDSLLRDLSFIVWTMFPFDHFSSDTLITLVAFFTFKFLLF